jgi:hypothetical protein
VGDCVVDVVGLPGVVFPGVPPTVVGGAWVVVGPVALVVGVVGGAVVVGAVVGGLVGVTDVTVKVLGT